MPLAGQYLFHNQSNKAAHKDCFVCWGGAGILLAAWAAHLKKLHKTRAPVSVNTAPGTKRIEVK
jgi:hypothetical protein